VYLEYPSSDTLEGTIVEKALNLKVFSSKKTKGINRIVKHG
jgi:hypothetical protein